MEKHGHRAPENASGPTERHLKRDPMEPEQGSLENQNVTKPAPIDQLDGVPSRPQPAGLEKQNVTQPVPPK